MDKFDLLGWNSQPLTKKFKCAPSLHSDGKKYADFQTDTIKEPTALQSRMTQQPMSVLGGCKY